MMRIKSCIGVCPVTINELIEATGYSENTVRSIVHELYYIGTVSKIDDNTYIGTSRDFVNMWLTRVWK